jgi:hypothetical protein
MTNNNNNNLDSWDSNSDTSMEDIDHKLHDIEVRAIIKYLTKKHNLNSPIFAELTRRYTLALNEEHVPPFNEDLFLFGKALDAVLGHTAYGYFGHDILGLPSSKHLRRYAKENDFIMLPGLQKVRNLYDEKIPLTLCIDDMKIIPSTTVVPFSSGGGSNTCIIGGVCKSDGTPEQWKAGSQTLPEEIAPMLQVALLQASVVWYGEKVVTGNHSQVLSLIPKTTSWKTPDQITSIKTHLQYLKDKNLTPRILCQDSNASYVAFCKELANTKKEYSYFYVDSAALYLTAPYIFNGSNEYLIILPDSYHIGRNIHKTIRKLNSSLMFGKEELPFLYDSIVAVCRFHSNRTISTLSREDINNRRLPTCTAQDIGGKLERQNTSAALNLFSLDTAEAIFDLLGSTAGTTALIIRFISLLLGPWTTNSDNMFVRNSYFYEEKTLLINSRPVGYEKKLLILHLREYISGIFEGIYFYLLLFLSNLVNLLSLSNEGLFGLRMLKLNTILDGRSLQHSFLTSQQFWGLEAMSHAAVFFMIMLYDDYPHIPLDVSLNYLSTYLLESRIGTIRGSGMQISSTGSNVTLWQAIVNCKKSHDLSEFYQQMLLKEGMMPPARRNAHPDHSKGRVLAEIFEERTELINVIVTAIENDAPKRVKLSFEKYVGSTASCDSIVQFPKNKKASAYLKKNNIKEQETALQNAVHFHPRTMDWNQIVGKVDNISDIRSCLFPQPQTNPPPIGTSAANNSPSPNAPLSLNTDEDALSENDDDNDTDSNKDDLNEKDDDNDGQDEDFWDTRYAKSFSSIQLNKYAKTEVKAEESNDRRIRYQSSSSKVSINDPHAYRCDCQTALEDRNLTPLHLRLEELVLFCDTSKSHDHFGKNSKVILSKILNQDGIVLSDTFCLSVGKIVSIKNKTKVKSKKNGQATEKDVIEMRPCGFSDNAHNTFKLLIPINNITVSQDMKEFEIDHQHTKFKISDIEGSKILCIFDYEEVGSGSKILWRSNLAPTTTKISVNKRLSPGLITFKASSTTTDKATIKQAASGNQTQQQQLPTIQKSNDIQVDLQLGDFIVEKIVGHHTLVRQDVILYHIKWRSYPQTNYISDWIDQGKIFSGFAKLIEEYQLELKNRPAASSSSGRPLKRKSMDDMVLNNDDSLVNMKYQNCDRTK